MTGQLMIALLGLTACDEGANVDGINNLDNPDDSTIADTDAASWYRDVQPILEGNCLSCHAESGISFSLEDYATASAMSSLITEATASGRMPPWPADEADCLPLLDPRVLSDDQIQTLEQWHIAGAVEGSPEDAPEPVEEEDLSIELDVWQEMATAYTPDKNLIDDYRCFVADPELVEDTFISGAVVFPGNTSVVHHVILYTDPEGNAAGLDAAEDGDGYTCFGGPGFNNTAVIGGWVPGSQGLVLPDDSGLRVSAGTNIVMQMHYHPDDSGGSDQTAFALDLEESVDTEVYLYPMADQNLNIPAGATDHVEGWSTTANYGINFKLWGGTPHMHLLGTAISISVTPPDSDDPQCIIDIPEWDFDYQQFYRLEEPYLVENGSRLELKCTYDNPTDSEVHWGDGTEEEMCLVYALISL